MGDTSSTDWQVEAFFEFVTEFKNETDRAAVIIGAAKLDYLLFQILSKHLLPSTSKADELLEGDSPMSSFSARIHLVSRLGILDAKFTRALHLIRKLRNSFAHEVSGCTLSSGAHRDRVRELISPFQNETIFKDFKTAFINDKSGVAADFYSALGLMVFALEMVFIHITTVTPSHFSVIPSAYKGVAQGGEADPPTPKVLPAGEP